jgi:hypothetical protein
MKLEWLITVCLNEMYRGACTGKSFSDILPIQNGLKQGAALLQLLLNLA